MQLPAVEADLAKFNLSMTTPLATADEPTELENREPQQRRRPAAEARADASLLRRCVPFTIDNMLSVRGWPSLSCRDANKAFGDLWLVAGAVETLHLVKRVCVSVRADHL